MRLERLTIGGPTDHPTHRFKNLQDTTVDFDSDHWVTVVIGWNGTGKSNILEALAIIFRELISEGTPKLAFAFSLQYVIGTGSAKRRVALVNDPIGEKPHFRISICACAEKGAAHRCADETFTSTTLKAFRHDRRNLPRYVFSYYSGDSDRLAGVFTPYLKRYDEELRAGRDPGPKRLFYAVPEHSNFVLLAFLIHPDATIRNFLTEELGIDPERSIDSVLFALRQPPWTSVAKDGDSRFWNARGIVQGFLDRLMDVAVAPIHLKQQIPVSPWNNKRLQFSYYFLPDLEALQTLVGQSSSAQFFRDLESTHVSQLIDEVRIRVRLRHGDNAVTFRELSEGEQQLLTVLGLLRFTAEDESLFLLDEPDTHLNPKWSVNYLRYLELFLNTGGSTNTSHVVLTTHNPIAIAGLEREQVQVLSKAASGSVNAMHPAVSPRGMGYAGVVTSDMFGLGSSLDVPTTKDLVRMHALASNEEATAAELKELTALRAKLEKLDFNFATRDRLEQEFRRARFDISNDVGEPIVTPENKERAVEALIESLIGTLDDDVS